MAVIQSGLQFSLPIATVIRDYINFPFKWYLAQEKLCGLPSNERLEGKTVLTTGSNRGIGRSIATEFAQRGAKVILACRSIKNAEQTANELIQELGSANLVSIQLDLSSFQSIRSAANHIITTESRLDVIINNAGFVGSYQREVTRDGLENTLQVNAVGPYLFVKLLLPLLEKSGKPVRVLFVTSEAYRFITSLDLTNLNSEKWYHWYLCYGKSKLIIQLIIGHLSSKFKNTQITFNSVEPGFVYTNIVRNTPNLLLKYFLFLNQFCCAHTPQESAQTIVYAAIDSAFDNVTSTHIINGKPYPSTAMATDPILSEKICMLIEKIIQSK